MFPSLESLDITYNLGTSIRHPPPHRQLTSVLREVGVNSVRPHKSDKTQRCGVSAQFVDRRMDHHCNPNHHTRKSRSTADHDLCALPLAHRRGGLDAVQTIGESVRGQWLGLDRILLRLWASRSIRPRIVYTEKRDMRGSIADLLPGMTMRGILHLVQCSRGSQQV